MATGAKRVRSNRGHIPGSKLSAAPRSRRPSVDDLALRAHAMTIRLLVELLARSSGNLGDDAGDALNLVKEIDAASRDEPMSKYDELESLEAKSAELNTRMQALRSEIEQADV